MYLYGQSELDAVLAGPNTNESISPILNPLTPMAFFPPTLAFQLTVETYITVSALAILVWDILHTVGTDYVLLTKHKIKIPTIVYFISRLSTFGSLLVLTIFATAPFGACAKLAQATICLSSITIPSTSLLLFFRVQALYIDNKIVIGLFFLVWVGVCCAGAISMANLSGAFIGPTQYCVDASPSQSMYMYGVALLANDTLTLLATSWRLRTMSLEQNNTFRENLRTIFIGSNLPSFSKSFLRNGQKYYLSTVGFSIFATITLYLDVVPLPLRGVLGILDVMLLNVMACRVFRDTKLGLYNEGPGAIASKVVNEIWATTPVADTISNPERHHDT